MLISTTSVEQLLGEHEFPYEYLGKSYSNSGWSEWREASNEPVQVPELGTVEVVDTKGGGEGDGEYMYMVFKVTDLSGTVRHYKKVGYYASFDGAEWDGDFSAVEPKQKVVTVFE